MIKNDFRYITKRILIGVGICLCLSFINSCNVKALEDTYYINKVLSENNTTTYDTDIPVSYSELNNSFTFDTSEYSDFYSQKSGNLKCGYDLYNKLLNGDFDGVKNNYDYWFITANSFNNVYCRIFFFNKDNVILRYTNEAQNSRWLNLYVKNGYYYQRSNSSYNNITNTNLSTNTRYLLYDVVNNKVTSNYSSWDSGNLAVVLFSSEDALKNVFGNPTNSTIVDLGIQRNFDDNNILSSVSFSPTFNNFDTSKFIYQYKIGNYDWLTITSNDITFNVNQNTSVYFRILNKSDNTIVDSRVYTITQIGVYENNTNEYKVVYSSENKSVDSSSSSPSRTIDRVTINFEYFPKLSNLKYQYQYVEEDSSLSDWIDMPANDYERGYTTLINGTMYNRILDENDNVLYTSTFNVNSIGKLMIDDNVSWYSSLFKKIDYGSGIGSIFFLPVRLIESIQSNFGQSCQSYNLGSLYGTDLILPCIDIKSYIGSSLYNTIDLIFMGFLVLSIIKFIISLYNRVVSLNFSGNDDGSGVLFL